MIGTTMRVLFLCHSHPRLQSGGTEHFSLDLFRELTANYGLTGSYLAGTCAGQRAGAPGTAFQAIGDADDEILLWTAGFDSFHLSQTDLHGVIPELTQFLKDTRPDIVHIHHTLLLGMEVIPLIKRLLPGTRIVMTLHDYYAMCANDGQMCKTDGSLCSMAAPDACHRCLPDRAATEFRMRELHIRSALRAVDCFIAPSETLREKFIAWGLDARLVRVLRNGLVPRAPASWRACPDGRRDRFGFFGHINRFKGATVALAASARLSRAGVAHALTLHGGTAFQAEATIERFHKELSAASAATYTGPYGRGDLARLMAAVDWVIVPSIWWENAPLVIQEAAQHRRPVICSDVGGMAEAVTQGHDGLHFSVGDPASLAEAMQRAIEQPGLWQQMAEAVAPPRTIQHSAEDHRALYQELAGSKAALRRKAA